MTRLTTDEITDVELLIENGLVSRKKHPTLDLFIENYTRKCQYTGAWTPMAEQCRGLMTDSEWNVIARPFSKFWNLNERLTIDELPDEMPSIFEKIDGFLTILYSDNGSPALATRGSFTSDMAVWATKWIRNTGLTMSDFLPMNTYLFEMVEPKLCREQGLIIDYYDRSECVLLAVRNTETGDEISHIDEAKRLKLSYAKEYTGSLDDAISEMDTLDGTKFEGYVAVYTSGLRIKLKCESYHHLHRLLSGLTPKRILEALINDGDEGIESMITGIPDESYARVKDTIQKIRDEQQRIINEGKAVYETIKELPTRKEQAEMIRQSPYSGVVFAILNGKDYEMLALKQTRKTLKDIVETDDRNL